jgi:hypothetical protein
LRLVCVLAIAAIAVCTCGCEKRSTTLDVDTSGVTVTEIGEGKTTFDFEVIDLEQKVTKFKVKTDKTIVGEALVENGLIEGDEGDFGLYVKKVNGIVADYDVDKTYWSFFINGEMAMTGVDGTEIEEGAVYSFKVIKE